MDLVRTSVEFRFEAELTLDEEVDLHQNNKVMKILYKSIKYHLWKRH